MPDWNITLISFILSLIKFLLSPLRWLYYKQPIRISLAKTPTKLGIIESSRNHFWEYGHTGKKKNIVIHSYWNITNTLPYNLTAINIFLTKPERVKGFLLIRKHDDDIWGSYTIPKGYTTQIDVSFTVSKILKPRENIKAEIELHDPTGRVHKVSDVLIKPRLKPPARSEHLEVEDTSKIHNNIEKQVIAVLKNEIEQYKVRGRREGQLGTVEWPRGMEWRKVNEKIKFLAEESNKSSVSSEHVSSLIKIFEDANSNEKKTILRTLLKRINKKTEYRDVGYLIVFILFELGYLEQTLDMALRNLYGDRANGFGDVLRILDILLCFRYRDFDEKSLDLIEKFVYATKEHPFSIKERVNAIRVLKYRDVGNLKIINATYGSGVTFIDIADKLNSSIQENKLKIILSNDIAGDPTPGVVKEAKIRYQYKGEVKENIYKENDTIELP